MTQLEMVTDDKERKFAKEFPNYPYKITKITMVSGRETYKLYERVHYYLEVNTILSSVNMDVGIVFYWKPFSGTFSSLVNACQAMKERIHAKEDITVAKTEDVLCS